jgi:uncharacterized protein (TIGR02996 family)
MINPNHPEYKAFVAQMRARPGDDAIRLVFADWVEEKQNGAALACLIRAMVEVGGIDPTNVLTNNGWKDKVCVGAPRWKMYADAERFFRSVWPEWSPMNLLHMGCADLWEFHRGFPEKVVLDWDGMKWLDTLTALGPVGEVEVTAGTPVRWKLFPTSIQFSLDDPRWHTRIPAPTFFVDRGELSKVIVNSNFETGAIGYATTQFLGQIWKGKVQRIRYTNQPALRVWRS